MRKICSLIIIVLITFTYGFSQDIELSELDFLIGTWKSERTGEYEFWKKSEDKYVGEVFHLEKNNKVVTRTMELKLEDGVIVYIATFLDKNKDEALSFKLLKTEMFYSFENINNKLIKKIKYKYFPKGQLFTAILGKRNKSLSQQLYLKDVTISY